MSVGWGNDAPTAVSGVMLGQLGLRLPFPRDTRDVLDEDKLADLINMDQYLTVRHFAVAEVLDL